MANRTEPTYLLGAEVNAEPERSRELRERKPVQGDIQAPTQD